MSRRPVWRATAHAEEEILNDLSAAHRMRHLSMKLHRVNRTGAVPKPGERMATVRRSDVTRRHLFDMVTVAHPRGRALGGVKAREQPRRLVDRDLRAAILTPTATDDRTTFQMRDQLHAVAHTEHRG